MFEQVELNSERWFDLKLLKNEIFKWIKIENKGKKYDFTNYYQISNYGRVKSMGIYHGKTNNYFKKEHILKTNIVKSTGYTSVVLKKEGKGKSFSVHRIVACTFLKNLKRFKQVNHKDGNKLNNMLNNLEWCDASYNIKHAYNNGLKFSKGYSMPKEKNPTAKYTEKQIEEIRKKRENGYKLRELAKEYETYESYICCICKRKFWK